MLCAIHNLLKITKVIWENVVFEVDSAWLLESRLVRMPTGDAGTVSKASPVSARTGRLICRKMVSN